MTPGSDQNHLHHHFLLIDENNQRHSYKWVAMVVFEV
jgi:hypothetical protein